MMKLPEQAAGYQSEIAPQPLPAFALMSFGAVQHSLSRRSYCEDGRLSPRGVLKPLLIMPVLVGMGNIGVNMAMLVDEVRLYQDILPV
jgi:hypothetical protein